MQAANQSTAPGETSRANGHAPLHDLFALTDEQILEIEPEAQDVTVSENVAQGDKPAGASSSANESRSSSQTEQQPQSAQARVPAPPEPPAWLAETMNDPQRGADAR